MSPRICGQCKRQRGGGKPQKSRGKNSSEEAAGARLRLVGSLRRTARAWGFSHHENPLAKPGCPRELLHCGRPAGAAARKEHIIHLHTLHTPRTTYLRAGKAQRAPNENAARQKKNRSVSGESSKVLSAPDQRPFGKTNRLSIIDGDEKNERDADNHQPARRARGRRSSAPAPAPRGRPCATSPGPRATIRPPPARGRAAHPAPPRRSRPLVARPASAAENAAPPRPRGRHTTRTCPGRRRPNPAL